MDQIVVSPIYGWAAGIALIVFAGVGLLGYWLGGTRIEGFMVMDRKAPWIMIAGTYIATWISAGTFIGAFALGYGQGFGRVLWNYGSLWGISFFVFFIGIPLRRARLITVPDFFHYFWNRPEMKVWATLLLVVAQTVYMIGQATAMGKLFSVVFPITFQAGATIFMLVVAAYVTIGGMWAVVLSDTLMFIVFSVATIIGFPFALSYMGGFEALTTKLVQVHPGSWNWSGTPDMGPAYAFGQFFIWFALASASPYLVNRAFVARSEKDIAKGLAFGQLIAMIFLFLLFTCSAGVYLFVPGLKDTDFAGIWFITTPIPTPVGVLLIAGVVAAAVSTVNTLCITVGEAIGRDIYQRFFNRNASERSVVLVTQGGIIASVLVALVGGIQRFDITIFILQWAAAIFLATYLPAFIMSLYWKGSTGKGIFWGMLAGGILYPTLTTVERSVGGEAGFVRTYGLHSVIYATAVAFLVMYVVSKLTKNSPEEEKRSKAYREICFPTGRLFAIAGKTSAGDWLWINVILAVNVLFMAWFIYSITR